MIEKKMKKQKLYILLGLIVGYFTCSCSDKDHDYDDTLPVAKTSLSISLNSSEQNLKESDTRSSGYSDSRAEKKIYSIAVLIFKSSTGELDGYKSINREIIDVSGKNYDKEYKEINEIQEINLTAGERDIYVVANAPDNYFSSVKDLPSFNTKYEELSTQGLYDHLGTTVGVPGGDPIGGVGASDLNTNLTMCGYLRNILFNNTEDHHYLGYTENGGLPVGVSEGYVLNAGKAFVLERLAARVAIQKIEFQLPTSLEFEKGYPTNSYTYQIDSVFILNAKTASSFYVNKSISLSEFFGHGNQIGFTHLSKSSYSSIINSKSTYTDYLNEPLFTNEYDITVNDRPLWFYLFENNESTQYPTSFVIAAKFNFRSSIDNTLKTTKVYYPIIVNANGITSGAADHNYIKRNYQYGIKVKIKGLGSFYDPSNISTIRSTSQNSESLNLELSETIGRNLFPWIGNIYK